MAKKLYRLTDDDVATVANYGSTDHPDGLIPYSALKVEHVDWVIPGHVPQGMLSVLAGEQGLGKSLMHAAWASALSQAEKPSILVSAEDSPTHTTKARLMAANANQDAVYHAAILPVLGNGNDEAWLAQLRKWILNTDAALLVFDPLSAFLDAATDSYKDQHVRHVLAALDRIAQETGCAIVYVMHLTKGAGANPMQRIAGSVAFTAAARSVMLLSPEIDPVSPLRILGHVKCNVAEKAVPQRWKIMPILIPNVEGRDVKTARIEYVEDAADVDIYTILAPRDADDDTERAQAVEIIMGQLSTGAVPSADLERAVRESGISPRTYDRARQEVGVRAHKRGKVWYSEIVTKEGRHEEGRQASVASLDSAQPSGAEGQERQGRQSTEEWRPSPESLSQSPAEEWPW